MKRLTCACCGETAIGRQWWNRDTGYGLCAECVPFILAREGADGLHNGYGIAGKHFAVPLHPASVAPGDLVSWKTADGERHVGLFKEMDNGTAIVKGWQEGKELAVRCV